MLLSAVERASFFEDLEDLESEVYDAEGKLAVISRIYRTQPVLLSGGPSSAAAQQDDLSRPSMQLGTRRAAL